MPIAGILAKIAALPAPAQEPPPGTMLLALNCSLYVSSGIGRFASDRPLPNKEARDALRDNLAFAYWSTSDGRWMPNPHSPNLTV